MENFISSEGTNNLNHLSDAIVCDARETLFIIIERIVSDLCPLLRWRLNVGEPQD